MTVGEQPSGGNPDAGLARAGVTAQLTVGFVQVWPARSSLPECDNQIIILRDWLVRASK